MLDIFIYPFMVRALIAGVSAAVLLGWLGTFVTVRKMSLIGDGIAHSSLAGIALAVLFGWAPLPVGIIFSIIVAVIIYLLEKKTKISGDMALALMFTTAMALGVILLHYYEGYQPELMSYLFGNILTISNFDLWNILFIGAIILFWNLYFYQKILFSTFDPVGAHMALGRPWIYDLILYISTAVSIVLSIKLVGIILVSALLVTPSAIAKLFAKSFKNFVILAVIFSVAIVLVGLILSYLLDWPSGAVIVLVGTLVFILSSIFKKLFLK